MDGQTSDTTTRSQLDYRLLFEKVPGIYLVLTPDLRMVAASDERLKATMSTREDTIGRYLFDVFTENPEDPTRSGVRNLSASLDRVLKTKKPDRMPLQKYDLRRPDGTFEVRYWSPLNTPILDEHGNVQFIIHQVEDVTQEVQLKRSLERVVEASLHQREEIETLKQATQFKLLIQNIEDYAIFMLDPEGRVLTWNEGAARLLGYWDAEIIGQPFARFYPPEPGYEERLQRVLDKAVVEGRVDEEGWRVRKDGSRFWAEMLLTAIRNERGALLGFSNVNRDLTERKRLMETQRENESRYRSVFVNSYSAILLLTADGAVFDANPMAIQQFGYSLEEFLSLRRHELFDPDDPRMHEAIAARWEKGGFHGELTFKRKNGSRFEGELASAVFLGGDGRLRTSMIIRDVTERVRAEEAQARLAAVVTNSTDAIFSLSPEDHTFVLWNNAAEQLFGFSTDEMLGQPVERFIPAERRSEFDRIRARMRSGESITSFDTTRLHKDGSRVEVSVSWFPVKDAMGRLINYSGIARDITAAKQLFNRVRESEQKFRRIVDSNMVPISMWSIEGTMVDANDAWLQLMGYTRAEILSGTVKWRAMFPPDSVKILDVLLQEVTSAKTSAPREIEVVRKDGTRLPVLLGAALLDESKGLGTSIVLDLTAQKRAEETRAQLAAIVSSSNDAIFTLDPEAMTVLTWNQGAENVYGYKADDVIAHAPSLFIPPERLPGLRERFQRIREENRGEYFESVHRRRDGSLIDVYISLFPVTVATGQIQNFSLIVRDITDYKRALEEVAATTAELRKAEELNRLKDHFLSTISHEMKTPLTLITGYTELLEDTCPAEHGSTIVAGIKDGSRRLTEHIDKMLDYSALLSGTLPLYKTEINLQEIAEQVQSLLAEGLERNGLSMEVEVDPATPPILGDSRRITQILLELLENAERFTPNGGRLGLRIAPVDDQVRLDVWDTGPGIPAADFGRIWEAFTQLSISDATRSGGLGLGLTITKKLVELHGGRVALVSQVGKGTTFSIYLPVGTEAQAMAPQSDPTRQELP